MIAAKARFRESRKIERALGYRIPDTAFHPAFLEAISTRLRYERLEDQLREQLLEFSREFLSCSCSDNPFCACPEKRFIRKLFELREEGLDHHQIHEHLLYEYGIDMYPADILSFLEESIHLLEAIRDIARLDNRASLMKDAERHIRQISGGP
ncbi:MAG: DUF5814 domain-containing protein [Methanomicrobiales archaeon]|nr:DUF5814 domain-containing protein [Methanomicrobiales archaeon]